MPPTDAGAPGDRDRGGGPDGGPDRAWGWVAALRAGATTPWAEWSRLTPSATTAPPVRTARDLPGAQQLELVRRLNLAARPESPERRRLVERVLTASATGRGAPDLELVGAGPERSWGPAPIDPAQLSAHDLLRVAATLVAQDVVAADRAAPERRPPLTSPSALPGRLRRRLLPRGAGHRVVGDPWLALGLRDELLRTGRPLGRPQSPVVVVGRDAASMLVGAFTARAFDHGGPRWERWLASGTEGALPRGADLAAVARTWSEQTGRDRVVIVPDPELVPGVLGLRSSASARARLVPAPVPADATDLARRVSAPLGLLVAPDERRRLLRRVLLPLLRTDAEAHPAGALAVPDVRLPWVVRRAEQMRDDLRAAGYPVVGDLQSLVPATGVPRASGAAPDDDGVLALAIRLLLAAPGTDAATHIDTEAHLADQRQPTTREA